MKRLLPGFLILVLSLSACGTVSVKVNWNPDQTLPGGTATPLEIVTPTATAYVTPDLTATLLSALLAPSPTATAFVPRETSQPGFTATPTPPAAVMPGAQLTFVRQDRIYWLDPGGNIYPLSDSAYAASSPLASPDNSLVVYFESRNGSVLEGLLLKDIVLASTSRSFEPRTLVGDSSDRLLSFSPDGQWLLTQRAEFKQPVGLFYYGLHIINVITGEDREVLAPLGFPNDPPILPVNPIWSPDSQHIFFDRKPASDEWPPRLELNVIDIQTGGTRLLLDVNRSGTLFFSPDGRELLVAGPSQLLKFNLDEVYNFSVNATPQLLMSYELLSEGALPQLRWADPQRIFLALPWQDSERLKLSFMDISTLDGQGTVFATYADILLRPEFFDGGVGAGEMYAKDKLHPIWTDDLSRAALNVRVNTGGVARSDILIMDGLGNNPVELLHNARFISWSPDGLYFLFISGSEENVLQARQSFDLLLGRADNAGDSRLIMSGIDATVALDTVRWLDGQTYVFNATVFDGSIGIPHLWRGVIGGSPVMLASGSGN